MKLANEDVGMLTFTSEQITVPFLLPEMVILDSHQVFLIKYLSCNKIGGSPSDVHQSIFVSFSSQFSLTAGRKSGKYAQLLFVTTCWSPT